MTKIDQYTYLSAIMRAMRVKETEPVLEGKSLQIISETIFDRFEKTIPSLLLDREPLYDVRAYMHPPLLEFNEAVGEDNILYTIKKGGIIEGERYEKRWLLIRRSLLTNINEESTVVLDHKDGPIIQHTIIDLRNAAYPDQATNTMTAFARITTMLDSLQKSPSQRT